MTRSELDVVSEVVREGRVARAVNGVVSDR